ncbi:hypothetical protein HanXRQr2_Chr09g0365231 [Helianthus annuus]|uniref:Uncharacterized protein n=1 Tax=Helianthus annuus TaxID=4232 RepID=A0A9K3I359_HELAN|nr:hypothetical protein HanXRQr2_Chr09g0365231 [Helianthus annuus]
MDTLYGLTQRLPRLPFPGPLFVNVRLLTKGKFFGHQNTKFNT